MLVLSLSSLTIDFHFKINSLLFLSFIYFPSFPLPTPPTDALAGLVVSGMVMYSSWAIVRDSIWDLTDKKVCESILAPCRNVVMVCVCVYVCLCVCVCVACAWVFVFVRVSEHVFDFVILWSLFFIYI